MESQNPAAKQSRGWIMSALVELMKEKDYSNIKVSDIVNKAMLARKTFYRHFNKKEDVLIAHFIELTNLLTRRLLQLEEFDTIKALSVMFQLVKENEEFFKLLYNHGLLTLLFNYWNVEISLLHQIFLPKLINFPKTSESALKYLLAFNVGGTFNIITLWIESDFSLTSEQLTLIVQEFATASLIKLDENRDVE